MKSDLYSELGVPKSASKSDIKRAYRRKAKQHHPDKKGSVVKWHALQQAYDTLSDDQARARYDETGEIGGKTQLLKDKAISELARLFCVVAEHLDPKHCNLVDEVKAHVTNQQGELAAEALEVRAKAGQFRDAADRFQTKDDAENFPAAVLRSQAELYERQAAAMEEHCRVYNEALKLLKQFSYRVDKGKPKTMNFEVGIGAESMEDWMKRTFNFRPTM